MAAVLLNSYFRRKNVTFRWLPRHLLSPPPRRHAGGPLPMRASGPTAKRIVFRALP